MDDIESKTQSVSYNPSPSDYQHQLREKRRLERLREDGYLSPSHSPAHVPAYRIGDLKKNNHNNNFSSDGTNSDSDFGNGNGGGKNGGKVGGNVAGGKGGNGGSGKNGGNGTGDSINGPWYLNGVFWKRASVVVSIIFSIASLILGAFASLRPGDKEHLRGMLFH
jgi:hypothetical protein